MKMVLNKQSAGWWILLLLIPLFARAQGDQQEEVKSFTLEKAQQYAVGHAYDVRSAEYDIGMAKRDVRATTALGLPQVEASGNYQDYLKQPVNLIPAEFFGGQPGEFAEVVFGTKYNATGKISANQLIFDGSYFVGLKASQTYQDFSREKLAKTKQEIRFRVAQSYHNVLVAQENKQIFEQTLDNLRRTYQETQEMYKEGLVEEQSVDQIELTVLDMENSIQQADRQIKLTKKMLKFRMGIPVEQTIMVEDSLRALLDQADGSTLIEKEMAVENHIDHQMAETQVELKELTMKNEQMDFLPKLNGFFEHRQNAQRDEFNFFDEDRDWYPTTIWGVNLTIPVFNSGRKLFQVQKARLDLEKAKVQRRKVKEQLKLQAANARTSLIDALDQLDNRRKSLELAQRILDKTIVKHREGIASSLELTQTKNQFLESQGQYIRTVFEVLQAQADLKKALNQ